MSANVHLMQLFSNWESGNEHGQRRDLRQRYCRRWKGQAKREVSYCCLACSLTLSAVVAAAVALTQLMESNGIGNGPTNSYHSINLMVLIFPKCKQTSSKIKSRKGQIEEKSMHPPTVILIFRFLFRLHRRDTVKRMRISISLMVVLFDVEWHPSCWFSVLLITLRFKLFH